MVRWNKMPIWISDTKMNTSTLKIAVHIITLISLEQDYWGRDYTNNSVTKFAKSLGMGKATVIKGIKELVDKDYLIRIDYAECTNLKINWGD